MRFLRSLKLLLSDEDDGTGFRHVDDGDALGLTTTAATFAGVVSSGQLNVSNADGLVSVPFGDVGTAKAVMLAPSAPINFRVNGGAVDLPLSAPSTAGARGLLYWEGDVTEMRVANPDTTTAVSVLYAIVGVE